MDLELEGRSVLMTASSSGLGLACAKAFARAGANVTICGRTPERLEAAREEVDAAGTGAVLAERVDITDPDDVTALVETTVDAFGGIDHVVTSAGGPPSTTVLETSTHDWIEAYDLLVMSVVWTIEAAHPHLVASDQGTITCITSSTVREVADGLVLSNAVRRAVTGLVKTVSREFAPDIRANTVLPGTIETPRIEELVESMVERGAVDGYEAGLAAFSSDVPMERIGDPDELGDVVAFLASPRASFVNGAAVPIDGGMLRS